MKQTGFSNKGILQNTSLCGGADKTLLLSQYQGNTLLPPLPIITATIPGCIQVMLGAASPATTCLRVYREYEVPDEQSFSESGICEYVIF